MWVLCAVARDTLSSSTAAALKARAEGRIRLAGLFLNWALEESTLAAYESGWRLFAEWARRAGWNPDRATPMQVVAYVRDLVMERRLAASSVRSALSAIFHHFRYRADNPVTAPEVGMARRAAGKAAPPPKPKKPLTVQMLVARERSVDQTDAKATRDFAMVLLAFGSFLRRGELTALKRDDVKIEPFDEKDPGIAAVPAAIRAEAVIWVKVRSSKTNPTRRALYDDPDRWETIIVGPNRQFPTICPLLWVRRWMRWSQSKWPARTHFFCQTTRKGTSAGAPLASATFAHIVKGLASSLGFDPDEFAGHSTRRGAATSAIRQGIELRLVSLMGRWRSDAVLLYVDNAHGDMATFAVLAGGLNAQAAPAPPASTSASASASQ